MFFLISLRSHLPDIALLSERLSKQGQFSLWLKTKTVNKRSESNTGAAGRLSAEGYPQAAPVCACAHLMRGIFIKMLLNEIDELFMENFVIFV